VFRLGQQDSHHHTVQLEELEGKLGDAASEIGAAAIFCYSSKRSKRILACRNSENFWCALYSMSIDCMSCGCNRGAGGRACTSSRAVGVG